MKPRDPALDALRAAQTQYEADIEAVEAILVRERSYVFDVPHGEDVVVLFSGGLDSVMMTDLVVDEWACRAHLLYVRRGARAQAFEEAAADWYAALLRERHPDRVADLTKLDVPVPPEAVKAHVPAGRRRVVGLPMRNAILQSIAAQLAVALNARHGLAIRTIFSGSVPEDGTCPELGLLGLRVQTLSLCVHLGDWSWQVTSPMIEPHAGRPPLDKRDLILRARDRGIPLDRTRTCFGEAARPDGTCAACAKRRRAFAAAGVPDPTLP